MHVLIATGSRHGSTTEIGERLAGKLSEIGLSVRHCDVAEVESLDHVDAVVLGSAVYMGQWTREAREFVDRFRAELLVTPTWVFSSGPIGEPPMPEGEPQEHIKIRERVEAEADKVFPGVLDRSVLGLGEKLIVKVIGVEEGDYRPWDEIDAFAEDVGRALIGRDVDPEE